MTQQNLIHIGPIRSESEALIKSSDLPVIVFTNLSNKDFLFTEKSVCEIVNSIVTVDGGEADYFTFNLNLFDGLAPATGLNELYPGICVDKNYKVETRTFSESLNSLDKQYTDVKHLILESPEKSLDLLNNWQAKGLIMNVETLWVRTSPISLYEGMATQKELINWCSKHGFEEDMAFKAEDPEFFLQCFKRNTLYTPLKIVEAQVEELKKDNDKLRSFLAKEKESNQEIQDKLEKNHQWFLNRKQEAEEKKEQLKSLQAKFDVFKEKYESILELAEERQQQIHELQRQNKKLKISNQQLSERQAQLQNELIKTEAHVELIKELMING